MADGGHTLRVLGAVRLSLMTQESTSPARQRELIEQWAETRGARVVMIAEDLDVSGAVAPFDRPGLGMWLTDEGAAAWDVLVAWKLDRISRSAEDTIRLIKWCETRGKKIVCISDGIDSSTQMGRILLQIAAIFAEMERDAIRSRAIASREKLRRERRWHGGRLVYGYLPEKQEIGWGLKVDPTAREVVQRIVEDVLSGKSLTQVARELNNEGVLCPNDHWRVHRMGIQPRGEKWGVSALQRILSSPQLLGYTTYKGEIIRDSEGRPLKRAEPLISVQEYNRLQEELGRRKTKPVRSFKAAPLLYVAYCWDCEGPLYHKAQRQPKRTYRYYVCTRCRGSQINAERLERILEEEFLEQVGHLEILERVYVPGEDHTAELEELKLSATQLAEQWQTTQSAFLRDMLQKQLAALDARIAELEALPRVEAHWELRPTGVTYREKWANISQDEKRKLLLDAKVKILAKSEHAGRIGQPGILYTHLVFDGAMIEQALGVQLDSIPAEVRSKAEEGPL